MGSHDGDAGSVVGDDPLLPLVLAVLEHYGYACTLISADEVEVSRPDRADVNPYRIRLTNLRQWTAREPRDQWPALVSDFLGSLIAATEADLNDGALDLDDYASVRSLLRMRLYAEDIDDELDLVCRAVAPGLCEVVVIDKPTTLMVLTAEIAKEWPVDWDELFRVARENVRSDGPLDAHVQPVGGTRLASLYGDTAYVTGHALWVGDYPVTGPYGALLAVPTQSVVHAAPLEGAAVPDAINKLIGLAWTEYRQGPRSVQPHIYRWHEGELSLAGTVEQSADSSLTVQITPEFQDCLEELIRD
ncbi:hypothetical protein [Actinomadura sp. NBRC 104425]|uniref:hypothetical protein n=1 Tax=Actinomadura sp. NBRC 104425 TaxID=3032204 RepID=UPI002556608B|nr:hypothetical protein [Actinomadura sp. NBRC 104425]